MLDREMTKFGSDLFRVSYVRVQKFRFYYFSWKIVKTIFFPNADHTHGCGREQEAGRYACNFLKEM